MLMTLLPPTDPESFADIGPGIWESIGYKVQDSLPLYVPRLASPSWIIILNVFEIFFPEREGRLRFFCKPLMGR